MLLAVTYDEVLDNKVRMTTRLVAPPISKLHSQVPHILVNRYMYNLRYILHKFDPHDDFISGIADSRKLVHYVNGDITLSAGNPRRKERKDAKPDATHEGKLRSNRR